MNASSSRVLIIFRAKFGSRVVSVLSDTSLIRILSFLTSTPMRFPMGVEANRAGEDFSEGLLSRNKVTFLILLSKSRRSCSPLFMSLFVSFPIWDEEMKYKFAMKRRILEGFQWIIFHSIRKNQLTYWDSLCLSLYGFELSWILGEYWGFRGEILLCPLCFRAYCMLFYVLFNAYSIEWILLLFCFLMIVFLWLLRGFAWGEQIRILLRKIYLEKKPMWFVQLRDLLNWS